MCQSTIRIVGFLFMLVALVNGGFGRNVRAEQESDLFDSIPWVVGPGLGEIGNYAEITVPEGFLFTGPGGTAQFLELTQNLPDPSTMGVLLPAESDASWVVFFQYDDSGHVKDDERDSIDPDALLSQIKQNQLRANEELKKRGWSTREVVGWAVPPGYEPATNRLAWATVMRNEDGSSLANYDVRLLGRTGVMSVTLACDSDEVVSLVPRLQELLVDYKFKPGYQYGEWREGDKTAAYGLTGLIVGGAAVAAAKSGWLAKLAVLLAKGGKAVFVAIVAGFVGLWRLITGKKQSS